MGYFAALSSLYLGGKKMPKLLTTLDEPTVRNVLSQEAPFCTVQSLNIHQKYLHPAYADRGVVEINDEIILKVPLSQETIPWMVREHWVLSALQGQTSVAIPKPLFVAQQVYCYAYQKVPGFQLTNDHYWTLTSQQKHDYSLAIAHFLTELHGCLDVSEAVAAGLLLPDDPLSTQQLRHRLLPLLETKEQVLIVEQILDKYEQIEQTPEPAVVLHGDLHGWNMAFDTATNQLAGVFDLNGACIGDPHVDLRYFFFPDPSLLELVLAHYQEFSSRHLSLDRCIFYAAASELSDLVYCVEEQIPFSEGSLSANMARLEQQLRFYKLL
jgi:aminoglycoside phosphotransferase (APT) family kinase protein